MKSLIKKNIAFVILNYNVFDMALECVDSIKKHIDTDSFAIVLVDNPSPANVGYRLKEYYASDDMVDVLCLPDNCGFARGNNAGIKLAREKYDPKFIVCLNNDTLLEQDNFYEEICNAYNKGKPAVIAPKVILKDGSIQPLCGHLLTVEDYQHQLRNFENILNDKVTEKSVIRRFKDSLLQIKLIWIINQFRHGNFSLKQTQLVGVNEEQRDLILHGCCLVFTPTFFQKLIGFNPSTFMFREEELLYIMLRQQGLHNLYEPQLTIHHLEDVSTDSIFSKPKEKQQFLAKNQIDSTKILIAELDKYLNC